MNNQTPDIKQEDKILKMRKYTIPMCDQPVQLHIFKCLENNFYTYLDEIIKNNI